MSSEDSAPIISRFRGALGHLVHRYLSQQGTESRQRGFGHEDLGHESAPQRGLDEIRSFGEKAGGAASSDVAVQLDRRRHPSGALG